MDFDVRLSIFAFGFGICSVLPSLEIAALVYDFGDFTAFIFALVSILDISL